MSRHERRGAWSCEGAGGGAYLERLPAADVIDTELRDGQADGLRALPKRLNTEYLVATDACDELGEGDNQREGKEHSTDGDNHGDHADDD